MFEGWTEGINFLTFWGIVSIIIFVIVYCYFTVQLKSFAALIGTSQTFWWHILLFILQTETTDFRNMQIFV